MPTKKSLSDPRRPMPAPAEYAGKWVAWDKSRTHIVAQGATLSEVHAAAAAAGLPDAVFERVRRPDEVLIGRL
jgi:hypothetical protein